MPFKNLAELKKHTLGEARQDVLRAKRKIADLRKNKMPEFAAFRRVICKNGFEIDWEYLSLGYQSTYQVNITSPNGFKDEKLLNIISYLDSNFTNIECDEYTYGDILEKSFAGTKNGVRVKIEVRTAPSDTCKRILVETKMVEQPVYRIQCD
jgi:hypothetical protein